MKVFIDAFAALALAGCASRPVVEEAVSGLPLPPQPAKNAFTYSRRDFMKSLLIFLCFASSFAHAQDEPTPADQRMEVKGICLGSNRSTLPISIAQTCKADGVGGLQCYWKNPSPLQRQSSTEITTIAANPVDTFIVNLAGDPMVVVSFRATLFLLDWDGLKTGLNEKYSAGQCLGSFNCSWTRMTDKISTYFGPQDTRLMLSAQGIGEAEHAEKRTNARRAKAKSDL